MEVILQVIDKDHPPTLRYGLHVSYIQKESSSHMSLTISSTKIVHPSAHKLSCWTFFGVCCVKKLHRIKTIMRTYFEECPLTTNLHRWRDWMIISPFHLSFTNIYHSLKRYHNEAHWINESLYYLTPSQRNVTCFDTYEVKLLW